MSVLLSNPLTSPLRVRMLRAASLIANSVEGVEHSHVGGERLFGDHITDKADQELIRELCSALTQGLEVINEGIRLGSRQEILRLPQFVNRGQKRKNLFTKHGLEGVNALQGLFGGSVSADNLTIENGGARGAVKDGSRGLHLASRGIACHGGLGGRHLGGGLAHNRGHPAWGTERV